MREQLGRLGLPFERLSAVDGRTADKDFLNKYYSRNLNKKNYYRGLTDGEIACYISHLKVCEKILFENLDYAIVLEDDIRLKDGFKHVPEILGTIPFKWNYIKLISPFKERKVVSEIPVATELQSKYVVENWHMNESGAFEKTSQEKLVMLPIICKIVKWRKPPAGTQAYAISRSGAEEFLAMRSTFYRPIDVDLQFTWETRLNVMGLLPAMCELENAPSEINREKIRCHYPFAHLIFKMKYAAKFRRAKSQE